MGVERNEMLKGNAHVYMICLPRRKKQNKLELMMCIKAGTLNKGREDEKVKRYCVHTHY